MSDDFNDDLLMRIEREEFLVNGAQFEYIGGHPKITKKHVRIAKAENIPEIYIENVKGNLIDYQWGEKSKRSLGSAAAGAIIGGVLTGGIGAIVGGAIGGRKQDNSILTIVIEDNEMPYKVFVRCDEKGYNEFIRAIS